MKKKIRMHPGTLLQFNLASSLLISSLVLSSCSQVGDCIFEGRPLFQDYESLRFMGDDTRADVDHYGASAKDFAELDKLISENRQNAFLYRNRGSAYYHSNLDDKDEKALADYDKAISLHSEKDNWYEERAEILLDLERFDEALIDVNTAIAKAGWKASFYDTRARVYESLNLRDKAFEDKKKAALLEQESPGLYTNRFAEELEERGRPNDALSTYRRVLDGDKDSFFTGDAYKNSVRLMLLRNDLGNALKTIDSWQKSRPDDDDSFLFSARIHEVLNEKPRARKDYMEAISILTQKAHDDDDGYSLKSRAEVYDAIGQKDKADSDRRASIAKYEESLKADPDEREDHLETIAELYTLLGDRPKADEYYQQLSKENLESTPESRADALHDCALKMQERKDFNAALAKFRDASEYSPDSAHLMGHQVDCLANLGRVKEALALAYEVERLNCDKERSYSHLAMLNEMSGNHQAAIDAATSALKLNSQDGEEYYWRGVAYEKLGKSELAKRDFLIAAWLDYKPGKAS